MNINWRSLFCPVSSKKIEEGEKAAAVFSKCSRSKLGIIAGGGSAPGQLLDACRQNGRDVFVICLKGQADEDVAGGFPCVWLSPGEGSKIKQAIIEQNVKEVVMLGRVRRPSLAELKPDALALKILTKAGINMIGDDALLTSVGKALEAETGARVISAQDVFTDLIMPKGVLTRVAPDETAEKDIARGCKIARELGKLDVGQAVIVQQGIVLGVEAIEGTDCLIARSLGLRREGLGGVLVKMSKPQQDDRVDLPAIGPDTIEAAHAAGLRGIAVEAGRSLFIERKNTLSKADELGIFIVGLDIKDE